jgi:hypothetical protein
MGRHGFVPEQLTEEVPDPLGHSPRVDEDQGALMRCNLSSHHPDNLVELFSGHHRAKLT